MGLNYIDRVEPDIVFGIVIVCQIIGSQGTPKNIIPGGATSSALQASGAVPQLPGLGAGTRLERLRDSIFFAGITAIIVQVLGWVEERFWFEFGVLAVVGYVFLIFAAQKQNKDLQSRFNSAINQMRESATFKDLNNSTLEGFF